MIQLEQVTEFVDGISLKDFVERGHALIADGRLSIKDWAGTVKYLIWKLVSILRWLHDVCHCTCVCCLRT